MTEFSHLATPSATRAIIERFGLGLKKSFGQNFLINDAIIGKILALAEVSATDCILEVGPGIGTLTAGLLNTGATVISIERDPQLYNVLPVTLANYSNFSLIKADALDVTEKDILSAINNSAEVSSPAPNKMVANLPYSVAATVILDYLQYFVFLQSATVMIQKEVAQRICARPGTKEYGAYTVKLSFYASVDGSFNVAAGNFMPPPHVESTVVHLNRTKLDFSRYKHLKEKILPAACTIADAAFYQRRKTIANSMRSYFANDPKIRESISKILADCGIEETRRGETLSQVDFLLLGDTLLNYAENL